MFVALISVPFMGDPQFDRERWLLPNGGRESWGPEAWALALGEDPYERTSHSRRRQDPMFDYSWAPGAA